MNIPYTATKYLFNFVIGHNFLGSLVDTCNAFQPGFGVAVEGNNTH